IGTSVTHAEIAPGRRVYKPSAKKQRHHTQLLFHQLLIFQKLPKSTMKCFVAILLLALIAIAMAAEKPAEPEKTKEPQVADAARDKRGLAYGLSPYAYPYAYNSYPHYPYTYGSYSGYYPYYRNSYAHYPTYYNQYPYYY
ncbi:PREDICTED: uncharacterized protein LOC105453917, partial [Wasmannia auropunctata]|uniref:uncharacterized protein LOC105453917 n=1 Tax=Wasmannia auropunctata TaxID=64793 RepID=UPI0005EF0227